MFHHRRAALAVAVLLAGVAPHAALAAAAPAAAQAAPAAPPKPTPALVKAVVEENAKKIDKLLATATGAAVDEADVEGRTALFHAALQGDQALVQRLLDKGAAVDRRDDSGATPLAAALRNPVTQWPTVKLLLDKGADVNAADKAGRTPLMGAVLRAPEILDTDGQVAMVSSLIAAGADPARPDAAGATALHHAAYVGEPRKELEILLAASKDPNAQTVSGANVLMMAAQNHQRGNADYLLAKGFRPVRIHAVGGDRPALAQDMSARANAYAEDWWGQYAARKGEAEASKAAFAAAAADYDAAATEARRLVALYEVEIVKDKQANAQARLAAGLASVLTTAVTMGAGYAVVYFPNLKTKLEEDERAIAALRTEDAESTARAVALRAKIAA